MRRGDLLTSAGEQTARKAGGNGNETFYYRGMDRFRKCGGSRKQTASNGAPSRGRLPSMQEIDVPVAEGSADGEIGSGVPAAGASCAHCKGGIFCRASGRQAGEIAKASGSAV